MDAARRRLVQWREAAVAAAVAEHGGDDGTSGSHGWLAGRAVSRQCFAAYLGVERMIRETHCKKVRQLDAILYGAP